METTTEHYATIWSICVLHGSALTKVRWTMSVPYIFLSSWLSVCQKLSNLVKI